MDIGETIESIVSWLIRVVSGLGFFLPIAIYAIFNLISSARKKQQQPERRSRPDAGRPAPAPTPEARPQQPPAEAMPFPIDLSPWFGPEPEPAAPQPVPRRRSDGFGGEARRDDPFRRDDEDTLRWGSAFASDGAEGEDDRLRWGSVFDEERQQSNWGWEGTKWGWDEAQWGGDFANKRDSEPKITVG